MTHSDYKAITLLLFYFLGAFLVLNLVSILNLVVKSAPNISLSPFGLLLSTKVNMEVEIIL